jgi:Golgi SNAP receptor complex protein 1
MNDRLTVSFHSAFKTASGSSVTDSLLAERGRIDNSHRMADETLE